MALSEDPEDEGRRPVGSEDAADAAADEAEDADPDADLVLACGRSVGELWQHVRDGRLDAHEETCPSCQEAAAEFAVLQRATSELSESEVDVPATLGRRVMAQVRTELRLGRLIPLGRPNERACVAEAAVAGVLREAVDTIEGIRARSCRITPRRNAAGAAVPGPVTVHLDMSVAYGIDIPRSAEAVRARVRSAARAAIGLSVAQVHVTAVDLWDAEPEPVGAGYGR